MKKLLIIRNSKKEILGTTEIAQESATLIPNLEKGEELIELAVPDTFTLDSKVELHLLKDSKNKVLASWEHKEEGTSARLSIEPEEGQYLEKIEELGSYILDIDGMYEKYSKK